MFGDARAQGAGKAALQGFLDFLEMRQRQADLFAAGDHSAVGVEQPKPGQRHVLGGDRSGIIRAPSATKAGSAGAAGGRASGRGGSTLSLTSSSVGQIG